MSHCLSRTQELYDDLLEHNREWQADRSVALAMRRDMYNPASATAIYENDDKCGSHWCKMPVSEGGRDPKSAAKAKYDFAIQANVVCGAGGVARLAVVPSNVQTGANFGLTNLVTTLWHAWKAGRLKSHCKNLVRHTQEPVLLDVHVVVNSGFNCIKRCLYHSKVLEYPTPRTQKYGPMAGVTT